MAEQRTVEYVGHKEFNKDREKMKKQGWHVVSLNEVKQPPGVKRLVATGLVGSLVVKPKSHFYVTYEK